MPFKGYSLSRPSLVSSCVAAKTLKGEEINNSKETARSTADIFHTLTKLKNAKGLFLLGIPVVTQAQIISDSDKDAADIPSFDSSHPLLYVRYGSCGERGLCVSIAANKARLLHRKQVRGSVRRRLSLF